MTLYDRIAATYRLLRQVKRLPPGPRREQLIRATEEKLVALLRRLQPPRRLFRFW